MPWNLTLRMKLAESSSACSLFNHLRHLSVSAGATDHTAQAAPTWRSEKRSEKQQARTSMHPLRSSEHQQIRLK